MNMTVESPQKTSLTILYNGRQAVFVYHPHEEVHTLLKRALHEFGIVANHDEMALFTPAGIELPPRQTLEGSGVHPDEELVLRQRVVRGGI
jgi:hypothetical protein